MTTTSAVSRTALAAGASVQAAGYGYTSARGPISDRALVADLTVVPNRVCRDDVEAYSIGGVSFVGLKVDTATAVCAIGVRPESRLIIDTCQGDSGGPLYAGTGSGQRLLGLVSVGVGCAGFDNRNGQLEELADKTPGIYTRITPYLDWLALVGVRSAPSAPVITATSVAEGIRVVFAPADGTCAGRLRSPPPQSRFPPQKQGPFFFELDLVSAYLSNRSPTFAPVGISAGGWASGGFRHRLRRQRSHSFIGCGRAGIFLGKG